MRITSNTINFPDETLADMWNSFDWNSAEEKILKWQKLLSIAAFKSKQDQVKKLSIRIVSSIEAKALAVHKVSEVLKSSPGIDNVRWIKASDKMRAAISLTPYNYKSKPFKRFVITRATSVIPLWFLFPIFSFLSLTLPCVCVCVYSLNACTV